MRKLTTVACGVALALAAHEGAASAQDCVRIDTDPPGSTVTLTRGTALSSGAPVTYCTLEPGLSYRLRVTRENHEPRRLKLKVHADGSAKFSGDRASFLVRSLLPGWGQASLGHHGRAFMAVIDITATGISTYQSWRRYDQAKKERDFYEWLVEWATTEAQRDAAGKRFEYARLNADAYQENLIATGALAGWWYLGNLFETFYLAAPPGRRRGEDGVVVLKIPKRSRLRGFMQSFFWPGMGQFYQGHQTRGFFIQAGFVTSALLAIDRKLLYDLRDIDYRMSLRDIENAQTEAQRDRLTALAAGKWDGREDRRKRFYAWAGVTAGLWLLNVIDAAFSSAETDFPGRFQPQAMYRSGTAYTGFKVTL